MAQPTQIGTIRTAGVTSGDITVTNVVRPSTGGNGLCVVHLLDDSDGFIGPTGNELEWGGVQLTLITEAENVTAGDDQAVRSYYLKEADWPGNDTSSMVTIGFDPEDGQMTIIFYQDVLQATPVPTSGGSGTATGSGANSSVSLTKVAAEEAILSGTVNQSGNAYSAGNFTTEHVDAALGSVAQMGVHDLREANTGSQTITVNFTASNHAMVAFRLNPAVTLSRDQLRFRFRNDDGSESAATWLAAENADITRATLLTTRLRLLLDMTGDAPSEQYQLEFKRNADPTTEWEPVL